MLVILPMLAKAPFWLEVGKIEPAYSASVLTEIKSSINNHELFHFASIRKEMNPMPRDNLVDIKKLNMRRKISNTADKHYEIGIGLLLARHRSWYVLISGHVDAKTIEELGQDIHSVGQQYTCEEYFWRYVLQVIPDRYLSFAIKSVSSIL